MKKILTKFIKLEVVQKRVTPGFIRQARTRSQLSVSSENTTSTKGYIGLRRLYANVDQLLDKMDDLSMFIADREPDVLLFTEVIPKAQRYPILETQLKLIGYDIYTKFNYTCDNLGASGIRGVVI